VTGVHAGRYLIPPNAVNAVYARFIARKDVS